MNGFPEDRLTKEFDKDDYQVLLVANKYQTGSTSRNSAPCMSSRS